MSWESDKTLIKAVESRPQLYDFSRKDYKDFNASDAAWRAIAVELSRTAEECKKDWKRIRDKFVKLYKVHVPSGSGTNDHTWELFPCLKFLEPCLRKRKTKSNVTNITEEMEEISVDVYSASQADHSDVPDEPQIMVQSSETPSTSTSTWRKRKRIEEDREFEKKILGVIATKNVESDSDKEFLCSLLPYLKGLDEKKKSEAKVNMLTYLHNLKFGE